LQLPIVQFARLQDVVARDVNVAARLVAHVAAADRGALGGGAKASATPVYPQEAVVLCAEYLDGTNDDAFELGPKACAHAGLLYDTLVMISQDRGILSKLPLRPVRLQSLSKKRQVAVDDVGGLLLRCIDGTATDAATAVETDAGGDAIEPDAVQKSAAFLPLYCKLWRQRAILSTGSDGISFSTTPNVKH
jgi:hypothetical protein